MDPIAQVVTEVVTFLEIVYVVISFVKFVGEETVASMCIQTKRSRIQVGNHLLNGQPESWYICYMAISICLECVRKISPDVLPVSSVCILIIFVLKQDDSDTANIITSEVPQAAYC